MYKINHWSILLLISIAVGSMAGCATATQEPTPVPPSRTPEPFTDTPLSPTDTPLPPTDTPTSTPLPPTPTLTKTETPLPTKTATSTLTPTPTMTETPLPPTPKPPTQTPASARKTVLIYFIHLGTGGTVGCGDSIVGASSGVKSTGDIAKDVAAGLKQLFTYKSKDVGWYYNPLYASRIRVEKVTHDSASGLISVHLSGTYKPSGDDCDNTRVKAQIWTTIKQFRAVTSTNIFLNSIPFGDRLSNDK